MNKHFPCGHWHKRPSKPPTLLSDDVYWAANCDRFIVSTTKALAEVIPSVNTGINQGCCADGDYFYVCDSTARKLKKYDKLTFELLALSAASNSYHYGACTDNGSIVWSGGTGGIVKLNKSDLTSAGVFTTTGSGLRYPLDMTVDDTYLYVADNWNNQVLKFNKSTMAFISSYGKPDWWSYDATGIAVSGDYVFVLSEYGVLIKADKVTWETAAIIGSWQKSYDASDPENTDLSATGVFTYGSYLYTVGYYGVNKWLISDLSHVVLLIDGSGADEYGQLCHYSWQGCTDGTYIYVCGWNNIITKWNLATGAFVAENGDRTGDTWDGEDAYGYLVGICCDDTYVYVIDQNDNFRVIKRLKSDLSFVAEYRSNEDWETVPLSGEYWSNPQNMMCYGDYVYISTPQYPSGIYRVLKADMSYVDFINIDDGDHAGDGTHEAAAMVVDGDYIYVSDYNSTSYSAAERYTFPGFEFVSKSPTVSDYYPTEELMVAPSGITVDETYLYVTDTGLKRVARYNKNTLAYVDEFSVDGIGSPRWPAVDDYYLYVALSNSTTTTTKTDYLKKYLKIPPFTEIASNSSYHHILSCDTPWLYQTGYHYKDE